MTIFLYIINFIFFLIILKYKIILSQKLGLTLLSTKKTLHKNNSYLLGGIFLFFSIFTTYIYIKLFSDQILYMNFYLVIFYFVIAFVDDRIKISPWMRLIGCFFVTIIVIYFDNSISIKTLNFFYYGILPFPESYFIKYIFPCLCLIILVNAFNFIDGIDGLANLIGISFIIYLIIKNPQLLQQFQIFIFCILLLTFANFKFSIFLGDSGNYLISIIIGVILLKDNYLNPNLYYVEEIFLLLLLPGLDMIRLFIVRLKDKKSPFKGDHEHLHHKLFYKYGKRKTLFIYVLLVNMPIYSYYLNNGFLIFSLVITSVIYFFLIYFLSKSKDMEKKLLK